MRKSICSMFWIISLAMMYLVNNSVSLAQSLSDTISTSTQSDQGLINSQQLDNDIQNAAWGATYYLSLKSIECIFPYTEKYYVFLKVNGNVVWGPEEMDEDSGRDLSVVAPIKVSKAKIELYSNSINSTRRATFLGKIYLTSNDLKSMVDTGEQCKTLQKKYIWTTALYSEYDVCFEVNSTNDASDVFVENNPVPDEIKRDYILSLSNSLSSYYTDGDLNPFVRRYAGQCTWYVYGRIQEKGLITYDELKTKFNSSGKQIFIGNANKWDDDARYVGFEVNTTPKANAIAVWEGRNNHVAFVESVGDGNNIKVTESNKTPRSKSFGIGQKVVMTKDKVRLREEASTSASYRDLQKFTLMEITGGPKYNNGYKWWELSGNGYKGWAAVIGSGDVWNYTGIILDSSDPMISSSPTWYIHLPTYSNSNLEQKNAMCSAGIAGQVFEGESIEDYQLGEWLSGVNVTLKGKGKTKKTRTNSRGYFFFYNLCAGKYTIKFKKRGYYSTSEGVTIYNDDDIGEGLFVPMSSK